ncbi:hypothetical protein VHEMI04427 [[Torrubiella] hemipterigena]|uniref:SCP domain-containing protein n=1 Tax=[Torrubiella] hemipterigena TaxID=1531966 RepID=A0A0A1SV78_9HYPO|nr:hypothetical protein VHEMI04427 [[Torrubiella] hemipterigena]
MFANVFFATALLLGVATASPLSEDPLQGRTFEPIEWEVQATPGGEMIKMNGTVEAVHEQLLAINPNYEAEFAALEIETPAAEEEHALAKRTDFSTSKLNCFGRWRGATTKEVQDGINYLRKVPGRPTNGPGPGNCGRVSCSWNAAISWCNDTPNPKTLASYGSIADGAAWIKAYCLSGGDFAFTAGQIFHPTGWNVIVYNSGPCK